MNRKWPAMNPPKWPTKNGAANKAAHFPTTASLITFQNPITALSAQKRTITSPSFQSRKSTPAREIRFAPIRARVEGDVREGGGSWRTGEAAVRTGEGALEGGGTDGVEISSTSTRETSGAACRISAVRVSALAR